MNPKVNCRLGVIMMCVSSVLTDVPSGGDADDAGSCAHVGHREYRRTLDFPSSSAVNLKLPKKVMVFKKKNLRLTIPCPVTPPNKLEK